MSHCQSSHHTPACLMCMLGSVPLKYRVPEKRLVLCCLVGRAPHSTLLLRLSAQELDRCVLYARSPRRVCPRSRSFLAVLGLYTGAVPLYSLTFSLSSQED